MLKTTIIDYGVGNLFSVSKAFEKATDSDIEISSDESEIMKSDLLVLVIRQNWVKVIGA